MKLDNMQDLLLEELRDLYDAEKQLVKALPKMAKAAHSDELRTAIQEHLRETEGQVQRLDQIFGMLNMKPRGKKCQAMAGLITEGKEIIDEKDADPSVKDAALIAAAQRVEHYEMAGYGCARTFAKHLGMNDAVELLQQTLEEEKAADGKLTELAESNINMEAKTAAMAH